MTFQYLCLNCVFCTKFIDRIKQRTYIEVSCKGEVSSMSEESRFMIYFEALSPICDKNQSTETIFNVFQDSIPSSNSVIRSLFINYVKSLHKSYQHKYRHTQVFTTSKITAECGINAAAYILFLVFYLKSSY